jgi:hypothetical protein
MLNFGNKEFRNLQEQVLKNAQDIETLKGRENLKIVIVEELPEVGNPNYIYLVPNNDEEESNIYDEYIWLADAEEYERIGGLSIDTANFVTVDSEQTISGVKTFSSGVRTASVSSTGVLALYSESGIETKGSITPQETNTNDIGSSSKTYKDYYVGGSVILGTSLYIAKDSSNRIGLYHNGVERIKVGTENSTYCNANWTPDSSNYSLGQSGIYWKNLYLSGMISDGANTVSVANIASKVTSSYASGTFDANGEDTIDTSGGIPEGLYIFTYGNCECFVRLTATMIQNADTTPIRIACPMIYNSGTVNGWLNITKSGYILILKITDGTNHVDSGYAWTLTKTNLI